MIEVVEESPVKLTIIINDMIEVVEESPVKLTIIINDMIEVVEESPVKLKYNNKRHDRSGRRVACQT